MGKLGRLLGKTDKTVERDGIPANATIVSVREGPPTVNGKTTFTVVLDVTLPQGTQRTQARQRISSVLNWRLTPGSAVPVRIDPKDHAHAVLDQQAMFDETRTPRLGSL